MKAAKTAEYLTDFYSRYDEERRLLLRHGTVEFLTTMRYIEMMIDMLPVELLMQETPVRFDIHFLRECRYGQTLSVGYEQRGRTALFEIRSDEGTPAVRASIEWK
jgi:acyl-ACP thioesterase